LSRAHSCLTISSNESGDSPLPGNETEASDAWLPVPDIMAAALTIRRAQRDGERKAAGEIWHESRRVQPAQAVLQRAPAKFDLIRNFVSAKLH
jgi:hypothetical protein